LIGKHVGIFCALREENSYEAQRISRLETAVVYVMHHHHHVPEGLGVFPVL